MSTARAKTDTRARVQAPDTTTVRADASRRSLEPSRPVALQRLGMSSDWANDWKHQRSDGHPDFGSGPPPTGKFHTRAICYNPPALCTQ